jgi:hypothetical protein
MKNECYSLKYSYLHSFKRGKDTLEIKNFWLKHKPVIDLSAGYTSYVG